jgi:nitroreductase
MQFSKPVTEIIRQRYSCRTYLKAPIEEDRRLALMEFISSLPPGPFGAPSRFALVAATQQDRSELRGLGTYGFIRGAPAFIIGTAREAPLSLEDFGYRMETIILRAAELGLGTCWLGGTFTRSSFARKIAARNDEIIPAVTSVGQIASKRRGFDRALRQRIGAENRLNWEALFFDKKFGAALSRENAGEYGTPLEMVRLGPSASNKQPWRVIKTGSRWHFYLQRTTGYLESWVIRKILGVADLQHVDLGIAMCHFELAAVEAGLKGKWEADEPEVEKPDGLTEYVASWAAQSCQEGSQPDQQTASQAGEFNDPGVLLPG